MGSMISSMSFGPSPTCVGITRTITSDSRSYSPFPHVRGDHAMMRVVKSEVMFLFPTCAGIAPVQTRRNLGCVSAPRSDS